MEYFKNFIEYIQFERRYSVHTVEAYNRDLFQFFEYVELKYGVCSIQDVNHEIIRSWIIQMIENKIGPRTINRKISTLKSFFKYLLREDLVKINPMMKVVSPKQPKKIPEFIDKKDIVSLFQGLNFSQTYEGQRNRVILEVFYATGMRLSELVNLKIYDVDFSSMTIRVLGKRSKERLIPITKRLNDILKEYLNIRALFLEGVAEEYLFLNAKRKKIYQKLVYSIVNSYLSSVTTLQKKSPHVLRHTFATHMLENGADINAIKELLGHANLSVTQIYTHNTIEKIAKIYKQAHPKA